MANFIELTAEWGKGTRSIWVNTGLIVDFCPNEIGSEVKVDTSAQAMVATSGRMKVMEPPEVILEKLENPELELPDNTSFNKIVFNTYGKKTTNVRVDTSLIGFMRQSPFEHEHAIIYYSAGGEFNALEIPKPAPLHATRPTHAGHLRVVI